MHISKMNKIKWAFTIAASLSLLGCEKYPEPAVDTGEKINLQAIYSVTQRDIDKIAQNLDVNYRVVTNIPTDKCDSKIADGACFEVELSFTAKKTIAAKDWTIHFSQISPIQSFESDDFTVKHLNGDLHVISLQDNYSGFSAGETKKLTFRAMFWSLSETDALPNYIVSAPTLDARVIESTVPYIDKDTGLEILPYVEPFTDEKTQFKRTASDKTQWLTSEKLYQRNSVLVEDKLAAIQAIIPTPKSVTLDINDGFVDISNGIAISLGNVKHSDVDAAISRLDHLGVKQSTVGLPLHLSIVRNKDKVIGSYHLAVTEKEITIVGVDGNGVFNGLQSLASLVTVDESRIPLIEVDDEPHFAFRGMLVDVARNFHSKEFILKLLDQMAAYKLNKLHLHLGDDEGWRLEIPSLPELIDIGAKRCFDVTEENCLISQLGAGVDEDSSVSGYYSVSEYHEILQAATARHIQVIPSLDMPGHSRASIKAMTARYKKYMALEDEAKAKQFLLEDFEDNTQYSSVQFYSDNTINACLDSSYDFVIEVMSQVKKIHADAGQPLTRYHIGADETAGAWLESPACKAFVAKNDQGVTKMSELGAYFIERVAGILSELEIETAGWSDGMEHTRVDNMPAIVQANAWDTLAWAGHEKVHRLANRDWQVVISSPDVLYFDFPHEADPKEHGYYWASRHTNTEKVFQFMPENLPIHAEFWLDREDNAYVADDTKSGLAPGKKFLGIQGQLWSENVRTDDMVEHKVFPRLLALAERAWHLADWAVPYNYQGAKYSQQSNIFTTELRTMRDSQWALFANTLGQKEFAKLELAQIDYRLPTVGAVIQMGKLYANIAFPGLTIEYQIKGGEWLTYQTPIAVSGEVSLRSRSTNGSRTSRITRVKE
ncbi:Beta-N-acetylhexosaminidase [Colwellia psychrerythraea]|uniref:beta-N-acetylhexosaminidase n=2 Tax=Colwellia psychrerythraea TaxID=28229 RepID=A0A099KC05_COLPS|nr:family 20 glycosylhydrolase [Colwellia psychrerythraea]KGJ87093.1 Beta-N-acetylhexosaminidase [Colwellia psychrerythraea]